MQNNSDKPDYRGLRALILTRVSTAKQEEKYSHAAQERTVREKLIEPLGLHITDEERHIIHDTYTGLEYRYREALEHILEMAERGEFDLLCMDVLDRGLGRKALAREMFRMQLRELGVRILTTQESDHADDDSLEGQIIRFHKGIKAEEEVNDLVRRTRDGKREKALGNPDKGRSGQVIGIGPRLYGYKYVLNEKGTRIGYELNFDVIFVDEDGKEWTEVAVVVFVFESAANGVTIHQITRILNAKGIPSPYLSKGMRQKHMQDEPVWHDIAVSRMLADSSYYGEYRQFKRATVGKVPGHKAPVRRRTTEEEQVISAIPPIVTKELAEKANRRVAANKRIATRNDKTSTDSLLRGGFAHCANCGGSLHAHPQTHTLASGEKATHFYYTCARPLMKNGRCSGCSIPIDMLDSAVVEYIIEVIRDPSVVDRKIQELQAKNPASKQQQNKLKNLNAILREQETFRNNLAAELRKKTFSERTVAFLNTQLAALEQQEQEARRELADQQRVQQQQENLERRIAEFHQQCQEWREKLDDPQLTPDFKFNREAVIFFGITVTVWRVGTKPRYEIYTDPPESVQLLS